MTASVAHPNAVTDAYRLAALAYFGYGLVYLVGGLYLIHHGVGVAGARSGASTASSLVRWGLVGSIPLLVIPLLLWRRWSWLGGWISRRSFAGLVVLLLALRAYKVGEVAWRGGGAVPAPWGGEISFRAGGAVFLVVTLVALGFLLRAVSRSETKP